MRKLICIGIICLAYFTSTAQTLKDTTAIVNKIFEQYSPESPGGELCVSRNNKIIYSNQWGLASISNKNKITRNTLIEAGSVSKQFTAAAILLLEQQGKLSVNDDVRRYIPELPEYEAIITIENLIHHTSGIKDCWSLLSFSDAPRGSVVYDNEKILKLLCRQKTLNHSPGENFLYSNSNYILLAIIVERVTKTTLAAFTDRYLFKPANMPHTSWRTDYLKSQLISATAYGKRDGQYFIDMPKENVYGNGGLLTTAADLTNWNNYLMEGRFGQPSLLWKLFHIPPLTSGKAYDYAAGLRVGTFNGRMRISHDGATAAYRSLLEFYPNEKISIAWLSNSSEFNGGGGALAELRNFLIPEAVSPIDKSITTESLSDRTEHENVNRIPDLSNFVALAGHYHSDEISSDLMVKIEDNKLLMIRKNDDTFKLVPASGVAFKIADSNVLVEFILNNQNQVEGFYFHSPKVKKIAFKRVQ